MSRRYWLPFALALGFLALSRLLAAVTGAADIISASVVLVISAVAIVAVGGALWSIIEQAESALDERRTHHRLTSGGAHR